MQMISFSQAELDQLVALHKSSFMDGDFYIDYFIKHKLPNCDCFVEKRDDKIVSVAYAKKIDIYVGNTLMQVPFLTGVATDSAYRHQGLAKKLLNESCEHYKNLGMPFILLHPFNHDFYRKQDYVTVSNMVNINTVKLKTIMHKPIQKLAIEPLKQTDFLICLTLYNEFTKNLVGYHKRDNDYYQILFAEHFGDSGKGYLLLDNGMPFGYLLHDGKNVRELIIPTLVNVEFPPNIILNNAVISPEIFLQNKLPVPPLQEHTMGRVGDVFAILKNAFYNQNFSGTFSFNTNNQSFETTVVNGRYVKTSLLTDYNPHLPSEKDILLAFFGNNKSVLLFNNAFTVYNMFILDTY